MLIGSVNGGELEDYFDDEETLGLVKEVWGDKSVEYVLDDKSYCPDKSRILIDDEVGGFFDYYQTIEETIERGKGDCEDLVNLDVEEMKKRGLDAKFRVGIMEYRNEEGNWSGIREWHCWVELESDKGRIVFDRTVGKKGKFGDYRGMIEGGERYVPFRKEDVGKVEGLKELLIDVKRVGYSFDLD
jgi:hypothetical protein|tara:strand:- start:5741 stop:6298 length:558 start_codon:yes stop_codon:yes gene_type:complete